MNHAKNGSDRPSFHHGQASDVDTESETIDDFSHSDKVSDKTDVRLSLDSRSETPVLSKTKSHENKKELIKKTSDNHTHREENDNSEDVMVEISKKTTIKKIISRTTAVNGVTQATEVEEYLSQNTETNDRIHEMFAKSPKSSKVPNKKKSSNENDMDSTTEIDNLDLNSSTKPSEYSNSHRDMGFNFKDGSDSIKENKDKNKEKEHEVSDRIIKSEAHHNLQSSKSKSDHSPKSNESPKDSRYGSPNKRSPQNINDKIIRKVDENIVYKEDMPEKIIVINANDNIQHLKITTDRNPKFDDSINDNKYDLQNAKYNSDIIIDKYNNKPNDKYDKYKYHRSLPMSSDFKDNPRSVMDVEKMRPERDYRKLDDEYFEKYLKNKNDYSIIRGNEKHDTKYPTYLNNDSRSTRPISWNSNSLSNARGQSKLQRSSTLNNNKIKWIDPMKSHHLKYDLKDNGKSIQNWIQQKQASLNRSDRNRRMKDSIYDQSSKPKSQVSSSTRRLKNKFHDDVNEGIIRGNAKENSSRLRSSTSPQRQYEKANEFQRNQPEISFSKSYEKPYFKSLTSLNNIHELHRNTAEPRPNKRKNEDLSLQVSSILSKFDLIKEELDKNRGEFAHQSLNDTDLCCRHRCHVCCCCCCCNQMRKYTSLEDLNNMKLELYQPKLVSVPMSKSPHASYLSIDSTDNKRKSQPSNSRIWLDNKTNRSFLNETKRNMSGKKINDPKRSREKINYKY